MNGIIGGLKGTATAKGIGAALGVVLVIALLYAFVPDVAPANLGATIRGKVS